MKSIKKFEAVQVHKATVVAKIMTYTALYGIYCALATAIIQSEATLNLSSAAVSTAVMMFGYATFMSFGWIKKNVAEPMINALTIALT